MNDLKVASLVSLEHKGSNVGILVGCYHATINLRVASKTGASLMNGFAKADILTLVKTVLANWYRTEDSVLLCGLL